MSTPSVSVIIPAYNYAHYLQQSAGSALAQTGDFTLEVIVVDDGSSDNTAEVAQGLGPRVRYIHQHNQGLSAARNTGIRASSGQFLLFLDADDALTPGTVSAHLDNFASHPHLDISVCLCLYFYPPGSAQANFIWPLKAAELDLHLCHRNISPVHAFMLRHDFVDKAGFFDTALTACEDHDYWLHCVAAGGCFGTTTQGLVLYRGHDGSMTGNRARQQANEAILHQRKLHWLEDAPNVPRSGKFPGWLAFAAGMARKARLCQKSETEHAKGLLELAGSSLLKAARHYDDQMPQSPHLRLAREYYAAHLLGCAPLLTQCANNNGEKGLAFLKHRFPNLAKLAPQALKEREDMLFNRLGCDRAEIMATVRRIMAQDSFLASLV